MIEELRSYAIYACYTTMVMKYIYYLQLQLPKQYKIASVDITPKKTFIYIYIFQIPQDFVRWYTKCSKKSPSYTSYINPYIYIYLPWDLNRH